MSTFRYEYIQCPDCGAMIRGRGRGEHGDQMALQDAVDHFVNHSQAGHFDLGTHEGLEAALKYMEELLPDVSLTLNPHQ